MGVIHVLAEFPLSVKGLRLNQTLDDSEGSERQGPDNGGNDTALDRLDPLSESIGCWRWFGGGAEQRGVSASPGERSLTEKPQTHAERRRQEQDPQHHLQSCLEHTQGRLE